MDQIVGSSLAQSEEPFEFADEGLTAHAALARPARLVRSPQER